MTTKEEILTKWRVKFACPKHKRFSGPITCDVCVMGGIAEGFISAALDTYLEQAFREIRPEEKTYPLHGVGTASTDPYSAQEGYNAALSDLDENLKRYRGDQT